jgi:hypothetical protein
MPLNDAVVSDYQSRVVFDDEQNVLSPIDGAPRTCIIIGIWLSDGAKVTKWMCHREKCGAKLFVSCTMTSLKNDPFTSI